MTLPELSNSECLPGRAGGSPAYARTRVASVAVEDRSRAGSAMLSVELDLQLRAAALLVQECVDTGFLSLDDVRGHPAAECLDERALIAPAFGYDKAFYQKRVKQDDDLLVSRCSLAADAAGFSVQLEVV
jgi:hypothetical protein